MFALTTRKTRAFVVAVTVGFAGMTFPAAGMAAPGRTSTPRFQGTFLQLSNQYAGWTEAQWEELFAQFERLSLSQVVVQWAQYDEVAFFPASGRTAAGANVLPTILRLADRAGLKVMVGLAHDSEFWSRIDREPALVEVYLKRLRLRSESVAEQLAPLVRRHSSFQGWYIPEEIDDVNWRKPAAQTVLFAHLRALRDRLRQLTPPAQVAISGFANGQTDPKAVGALWLGLLQATGIDVVMFQDGVGVRKLDLNELPLYLGTIKRAVSSMSRDLQVVVEIFQQVNGPPLDSHPFKAVPAEIDRVSRQLDIAGSHSTSGVLAFAVPDYMTPARGLEAAALLTAYLAQQK